MPLKDSVYFGLLYWVCFIKVLMLLCSYFFLLSSCLHILSFNDKYSVDPRETLGGCEVLCANPITPQREWGHRY